MFERFDARRPDPVFERKRGLSLLLASLASWTIIFRKKRLLSLAESEANRFESARAMQQTLADVLRG